MICSVISNSFIFSSFEIYVDQWDICRSEFGPNFSLVSFKNILGHFNSYQSKAALPISTYTPTLIGFLVNIAKSSRFFGG